jgi:hypothetical protein
MPPKRRREAAQQVSLAVPNYLRSGLLLDPNAQPAPPADSSTPLSAANPWTHLGVPEKSDAAASLKWRIDQAVIPQCVLQQIVRQGTLSIRICALLGGSRATEILERALPAARMESGCVEIFPRRLSMLVTRDGKVMQTKDAGLRPTNEVASIDLSTVQAALLFGRDRSVVDIPIDHPSCSGQHAVVASRMTFDAAYAEDVLHTSDVQEGDRSDVDDTTIGDLFDVVLYIKDLRSTHGTKRNGELLPPNEWVPLRPGDRIVFGLSTREYVVMESQTLS